MYIYTSVDPIRKVGGVLMGLVVLLFWVSLRELYSIQHVMSGHKFDHHFDLKFGRKCDHDFDHKFGCQCHHNFG